MAIVLKESSAKGKAIIQRGSQYKGATLRQVYDSWSQAKENAYNYCYNKYLATLDHDSFSICSANGWAFTCSWLGKYEEQDALFFETKDNSYIVLFE